MRRRARGRRADVRTCDGLLERFLLVAVKAALVKHDHVRARLIASFCYGKIGA
jgi:hypothetical protein